MFNEAVENEWDDVCAALSLLLPYSPGWASTAMQCGLRIRDDTLIKRGLDRLDHHLAYVYEDVAAFLKPMCDVAPHMVKMVPFERLSEVRTPLPLTRTANATGIAVVQRYVCCAEVSETHLGSQQSPKAGRVA